MTDIVVIAHDIRSTHNIGSLFRTCEGLGVNHVFITGYTPYPLFDGDHRLPHIAKKLDMQIHKTALDSEKLVAWTYIEDVDACIHQLKRKDYRIVALEQTQKSIALPDYPVPHKVALLLGREVAGIEPELFELCDDFVEIPMYGKKESFNVVQAAAIALYHLRIG